MTTIIKLGGAVCDDDATLDALEAAWHADQDGPWVVVHGAGPQLDSALEAKVGPAQRVEGLRVTPPAAAQTLHDVLADVGAGLAAALRQRGLAATQVPMDWAPLRAQLKSEPAGLGRVGTPVGFDASAVTKLASKGSILVLAPLGWDDEGPLNVNADEAACAIAATLGADRLVLATDVKAVLDLDGNAVAHVHPEAIHGLVEDGTAKGGMVPKLRAAGTALATGVKEVMIGSLPSVASGGATRVAP